MTTTTCACTTGHTCTRESEPGKTDCFRCFTARKAGRDCQPTTEQRILALVSDAEPTGVTWFSGAQFAHILGMDADSAILAGTLARMVASGALGAYVGTWMGAPVTRYCTVREAEAELARRARVSVPLRARSPMDTIAGKATLEAKVGVDRAGDIIAGSTR